MALNHLAAVLLFSGPFFWVGLWMSIDPGVFHGFPNRSSVSTEMPCGASLEHSRRKRLNSGTLPIPAEFERL
jgi:hypothetical protein